MTVKNTSKKPITMDNMTILPGEIKSVSDAYAEAVSFFEGMGMLQTVSSGSTKKKATAMGAK